MCEQDESGVVAQRHAIEDARRSLDEQLQEVNDISLKSWRAIKFNGLILTIVASISPFGPFEAPAGLPSVVMGIVVVVMVISTYLSLKIQRPNQVYNGPDTENFEKVCEDDFSEGEYLSSALQGYYTAIRQVQQLNEDNADRLEWSVFTSAVALVVLFASFVWSFTL